MTVRLRLATTMAFRDQRRRPLVMILIVVLPVYVVTRSIAITQATPRRIELPGGAAALTTMKELHGAVMAGTAIAFVTALVGVFVMRSAQQGDRRLVQAGYTVFEAVTARLAVLLAGAVLVVAVSVAATAIYFTPASWSRLVLALVLIGLIYGALGTLAGALMGRLAATYLILFLVMTDLGIVQNPMFGDGTTTNWGKVLPSYGPSRVMVDAAFSPGFHTAADLALGIGWAMALVAAVGLALKRTMAVRGG